MGKRKEVPKKEEEKNTFLKEKHNFQLDDTTGVGKSRVANMAVKNLRLKVTELGLYDGFMFGCLVGLAKDVPTGSQQKVL